MQARRAALAALLMVALLPSAHAANSANMTFNGSFTTMTIQATVDASGQEAQGMRQAMDSQGNGDGSVTPDEKDEFVAFMKSLMAGQASQPLGDNVTLDGEGPKRADVTKLDILGATGAVSSSAVMTMVATMEVVFEPGEGSTHTLRMVGRADPNGSKETAKVSIRAPANYTITSHDGIPGASLSSDKTTLSFTDSASSSGSSTIVFGQASEKGAPAPGVLAVLAALAAVVLVLRRR